MSKFSYECFLRSIVLPKEEVMKIFVFDKEPKLRKQEYADIFCLKTSQILVCPLNFVICHSGKTKFSFYVACITNKSKRYKLECSIQNIKENEDLTFDVYSSNSDPCEHPEQGEFRQVRGSRRDQIRKELTNKRPKEVNISVNFILDDF